MLADGKIDGPGYGSKIHPGSKHKVGEKLIGCSDALKLKPEPKPEPKPPAPKITSFRVVSASLKTPPANCRWANVADVKANRPAAFKNLKTWSIVMLTDGKIDGPGYGSKIHPGSKHKVGEKLAGCW